jgi:glycosyltransferase involved in cell wall biosynthesis
MLSDSALRDTLRAVALQRARLFDWQRTADQTLEVYRRLAP